MTRMARRFLRAGSLGRTDPATLAEACARLVLLETSRSLKNAFPLAQNFLKFSRPHGGILLQTALRALGWTYLAANKYAQAEKCYLEAREITKAQPLVRARIDRTLIDIYMYLGDFRRARRRAGLAMTTFRRLHAESDLAKTRINYANLFHRQDRHREAIRQYRLATKTLKSLGDNTALAYCQYNYANSLVQLFDFARAENLYRAAEEQFGRLGFALNANECRYGLAWLWMLQGRFHQALLDLAGCEKQFRKIGHPKGVVLCRLDRAETYLSLNLFADARQAAREAEKAARRLGLRYEEAKASFFRAKAAHAVGDSRDARVALKRAEENFRAEGNHGFLGATQLTNAQIGRSAGSKFGQLASARRRFARAQLPLWEAICDLQVLTVRPDDPKTRKRLRRNPAVKTVPHLYALWQTLMGDSYMNQGRLSLARQHWRKAATTLDAVRAKLPPVELQSAFMTGRSDPYLRLVHSLSHEDPAEAAAWSERHRTSGLWSLPSARTSGDDPRSRAEHGLSDLAQRVSVLSSRIADKSGLRATGIASTSREFKRLQRQIHLDMWALAAEARPTGEALVTDLRQVADRYPIVQFHGDGPDLLAFVHIGAEVRCHRYTDGGQAIRRFQGCWQILLSRSLLNKSTPASADMAEEARLFSDLGSWLWSPLEISAQHDRVLVLPEGRLSNLPWQALLIDNQPLVERHSIVLAPSLRHHLRATATMSSSKRLEVFVGDTDGLPNCRGELQVFSERTGHEVLMHDPCSRCDWPDNGEALIWHFTGHARLRSDNPFYSSLELSDGPMFAADFRLKRNRVGLVTLAACRTGEHTYLPGEEASGLVRALLEMGARSVIASHWAVEDKATALWMREFYARYLTGVSLEDAMRQSALQVRERYISAHHWAAFSLFGAA